MQHKCNRKKFLRCCKEEKKCCKAISSFRGALQNRSQTARHSLLLLPLNSGFDDAAKIIHMCNALLAYHKQYYKWTLIFFEVLNVEVD